MEEKIVVECDCGCSVISLQVFDEKDETFVMSHFYSSFYSKQEDTWEILKRKAQMIWFIITGKEFRLYDVILSKENALQIKKFFKNVK